MEAAEEEGFAPSALGTQAHWDAVYERELRAFQECGDSGEIWEFIAHFVTSLWNHGRPR